VLGGGEEAGGNQQNSSFLSHLEDRVSDIMSSIKQDLRPPGHSINSDLEENPICCT